MANPACHYKYIETANTRWYNIVATNSHRRELTVIYRQEIKKDLCVHSASNHHNEKNYEFYWGYKNYVLCDCITAVPIYELTTTTDVVNCTVAPDILSRTNGFRSIQECAFIGDKGYDARNIYNTIKCTYDGE